MRPGFDPKSLRDGNCGVPLDKVLVCVPRDHEYVKKTIENGVKPQ